MSAGHDTLDPQPFVLPSAQGSRIHLPWSRVAHLDEDVLTHFVRYDLGRDDFDPRLPGYEPVSPEAAAYWRSVNDFVRARMIDGSADHPLIAASLQHLVLSAYLYVFPTASTDARAPHEGGHPAPAALRRARTYIEEHADQPVTVFAVAQAARMSARGLQQAFRRVYDTTPMAYLHTVRLAGARRDLIAANPTRGTTVRDVAARWGFPHASRFSARYKEAFGESPSATLRR